MLALPGRTDMTPPVDMYTRTWSAWERSAARLPHWCTQTAARNGTRDRHFIGRSHPATCGAHVGPVFDGAPVDAGVEVGDGIDALGLQEEHQLATSLSHTHAGPGIISRQRIFSELPGGELLIPSEHVRQSSERHVSYWKRNSEGLPFICRVHLAKSPICTRLTQSRNLPTEFFSLHISPHGVRLERYGLIYRVCTG